MTITYLGSVSVGATVPGVGAALAVSLQDLNARITALLSFSPGEVNFAAELQIANQILANIQAAIIVGITPPSISVQVGIIAALLAALEAQLQVIAQLQNLFLAAGVDVFVYDGTVGNMGAEVTAALSGGLPSGGTGATHCDALILATSVSATFTAMQGVFLTS